MAGHVVDFARGVIDGIQDAVDVAFAGLDDPLYGDFGTLEDLLGVALVLNKGLLNGGKAVFEVFAMPVDSVEVCEACVAKPSNGFLVIEVKLELGPVDLGHVFDVII